MATPNKRRQTRRRKPAPTPYRTLYDGAAGEPAAPDKLRTVLTMLDDARNAELWLRHEAVAVEPENPVTAGGELAHRKHLTRVGWTTVERRRRRRLRSIVFDDTTATEEDVDDIIAHAVTCAAWEIKIVKSIRACDPHDDEMVFDYPIETLSIQLADGQSLEQGGDAVEHSPSHFIVDADIHAGQTMNATLRRFVEEDSEIRETVPANPRVQLCLDWLCRHALTIIRDRTPGTPPNIIEAVLSKEAGGATEPPAGRADTDTKPTEGTGTESRPKDTAAADATAAHAQGPSGEERRGPARRAGNSSETDGSRYRYH